MYATSVCAKSAERDGRREKCVELKPLNYTVPTASCSVKSTVWQPISAEKVKGAN